MGIATAFRLRKKIDYTRGAKDGPPRYVYTLIIASGSSRVFQSLWDTEVDELEKEIQRSKAGKPE